MQHELKYFFKKSISIEIHFLFTYLILSYYRRITKYRLKLIRIICKSLAEQLDANQANTIFTFHVLLNFLPYHYILV